MTRTILLTITITTILIIGFSATETFAVPTETIVNGGFETGTFAGWTGNFGFGCTPGWQINNGGLVPPGPSSPIAPISGRFDAVGTQCSGSTINLVQSFTIPNNVVSAQLSWNDRIRSHATLNDPNQEARVQILSGATILSTVFSTNPGDPAMQIGPNARSFDVTALLQANEGRNLDLRFQNTVNLNFMNWSVDDVSLLIETNQAPDCSVAEASTSILWPPNHKMDSISINGVTDPDGDPVTITITGITQDEPVNGLGDGDTAPDGAGIGTDTAQVRAERSGTGDGRVYEISFTADDGNSGTCFGLVQVGVPHDKKDTPVDSGLTVDSTTS